MKKILILSIALFAIPFSALYAQIAQRVKNINLASNSNPIAFTELNGKVFFAADDGVNGYELWSSDGSDAGTVMVKNINPTGAGLLTGVEFVKYNNKLIFSANDGVTGKELWISDGTAAGTMLLKDIRPNSTLGFAPHSFTVCNNKVFFFANDGTTGTELFVTDGTAAGTNLVRDINVGTGFITISATVPRQMMVYNNEVFFVANTTAYGEELWHSDGTAIGTRLLKDINPTGGIVFDAAGYSSVGSPRISTNYIVHDNLLWISLNDGTTGRELWVTDGNPSGTTKAYDFTNFLTGMTNVSTNPSGFFINELGRLCFTVTDGGRLSMLAIEMRKSGTQYVPNYYATNLCPLVSLSDGVLYQPVADTDFLPQGFLVMTSCNNTELKNSKTIVFDKKQITYPGQGAFVTDYHHHAFYHNQIFFPASRAFFHTVSGIQPPQLFRASISKHLFPARDSSAIDSVANRIIVSSVFNQATFGQANETLFFTATDASGDIELYKIYTAPVATESSIQPPSATQIKIAPNPVAAGGNLALNLTSFSNLQPSARLTLSDIFGRALLALPCTTETNSLTLPSTLAAGVYLLQITQESGRVGSVKVVVQ